MSPCRRCHFLHEADSILCATCWGDVHQLAVEAHVAHAALIRATEALTVAVTKGDR